MSWFRLSSLFFQHDAVDLGGAAQASLARRTGRLFINYHSAKSGRDGGRCLLERGLQFPVARGLRHLRQRAQDLLLGEVDVLQSVVKELVQFLRRFSHVLPPFGVRGSHCPNAAFARKVLPSWKMEHSPSTPSSAGSERPTPCRGASLRRTSPRSFR